MSFFDEDHYEVLITAANTPVALGDGKRLRGTVFITGREENILNLKMGVLSKLTPSSKGTIIKPEDVICLEFPHGVVLANWAIIGPAEAIGQGVLVMHGGGFI